MFETANRPGNYTTATQKMEISNSQSMRVPFEIYDLDFLQNELSEARQKVQRSDRFEMLWIREGKGAVMVDNHQYEIINDVIYCIAPGHMREYQLENCSNGCYISFTPDFIQLSGNHKDGFLWFEEYENFLSLPVIHINDEIRSEMEEIVRQMKKEFSNYMLQRPEMLKGLLNIFALYFSGNVPVNYDTYQSREKELSKSSLHC